MTEFISFVKKHAHHLVFGITLIALASLLAWWFYFIRESIHTQRSLRVENLELKLDYFALNLMLEGGDPPPVGASRCSETRHFRSTSELLWAICPIRCTRSFQTQAFSGLPPNGMSF